MHSGTANTCRCGNQAGRTPGARWRWRRWVSTGLLASILPAATPAGEEAGRRPWQSSAWGVESGVLWQFGVSTPFDYRMVQTQLSWRSPEAFGWELGPGSRLLVRHRLTFIGAAVQAGPESRYVGFAGSPSVEWWNRAGTRALFSSAGGGYGLIDSRQVPGGQGQDFTLNWFARAGVEQVASRHWRLSAAIMFQHLSNAGQTNPNPGIDVLGLMIGCAWSR